MESIYWVLSRDCNQRCAHCYNDSEPGAPGLTVADIAPAVANLPDPDDVPVDRIILSGGEVLVWPELLFATLTTLYERYGDRTRLMVQTNGDLLDEGMLDTFIEHHVARVDVSSMDRFHPKSTLERRDYLEQLLQSRGFMAADTLADTTGDEWGLDTGARTYAFWGANPDLWIGALWPRGRARRRKLTTATPDDRFCSMWSGAKNFLNYRAPKSEINIQLADVYPCCPMTTAPIGNILEERLIAILDRCAQHPAFRALNEGRPEAMGEYLGITEAEGFQRSRE
ncbi:MAG: radical SAM protein, partial [Candidatus Hydrogenedentales bacterium]